MNSGALVHLLQQVRWQHPQVLWMKGEERHGKALTVKCENGVKFCFEEVG